MTRQTKIRVQQMPTGYQVKYKAPNGRAVATSPVFPSLTAASESITSLRTILTESNADVEFLSGETERLDADA